MKVDSTLPGLVIDQPRLSGGPVLADLAQGMLLVQKELGDRQIVRRRGEALSRCVDSHGCDWIAKRMTSRYISVRYISIAASRREDIKILRRLHRSRGGQNQYFLPHVREAALLF